MMLRDELAETIQSVLGPLIDPALVSAEWTEAADKILKKFEVQKKSIKPHQHEGWMIRKGDDGTHYCAACGQEVPSRLESRGRLQDGEAVVWNDRPYTVMSTTLDMDRKPWALLKPNDPDLTTSWVPEREIKREEG